MKIDGQSPKVPVQDKNVHRDKTAGTSETKKATDLHKTDPKQFSVNKIRGKIDAEPDIDLEKVKALKAKIKNGEYQVDTKKLANNLLKNSLLEDI
ncbi:MAG: flagellar biosynthesis anti-sigma factor FlgM [Deltaproteobacteria bacterium]|jgi:flagellar biosynthesis anti-sigma factor FlgM|nr:flagellar biosynthesis anti-sigma factor FlgM [Deltaproteobacteria bacterium]MBT4265194.1 flagellar biosynthesis anti-sigma factor FlgM [Deltaproteobacteria bacterium]MBT4638615.1 flagellar biosynthesis anti-sigma factor FlgM [Deltaproteobacteria bacterium]MBT6503522.1 flagellar biosynthesis anti-sigma factor FlgM [Deltaproteobacteria bacterium]MBT6611602.1 flagellar biosynthesis anti-sigma factor FlgM [Deltaproteobacteria bacterium]